MTIKEKIVKVEVQLCAAYDMIKEINDEITSQPSEPDYSTWKVKLVFVRDDAHSNMHTSYFVKYDSKDSHPFRTNNCKKVALNGVNGLPWKQCRLVRDWDDLLRGVW